MVVNENEFFRQATLRICSSLNLETALERCLDYMQGHLPASGAFMGYYEPDLRQLHIVASAWPGFGFKSAQHLIFPSSLHAAARDVWERSPRVEIFEEPRERGPDAMELFSKMAPIVEASHIGMSLHLESERVGYFSLFAEGQNRFGQHHARLLKLLHDPFAVAMNNSLQHQEILRLKDMLKDDNQYLRHRLVEAAGDTIIGADFGLRGVMEMVRQVAPLDSPVLLLGETGVGKEVIANAIHYSSPRRDGPFIKMNCGALPEGLIDAELFGHEKGAFTGAMAMKRGRFERADHGTIFLDEVGDLPPEAQVRLLRVIQYGEIERVGGAKPIPLDVRVISATHQNLQAMVQEGRFREDLWYRLNVFPINIPPLRQRTEDIPALVAHFMERKSRDLKMHRRPQIRPGGLERLQAYSWPGNVRELENVVERALIRGQADQGGVGLHFADLPGLSPAAPIPAATAATRSLDAVMAEYIRQVLEQAGGRVEGPGGAAEILGLHPSTLRARMRKLGIPHGRRAHGAAGAG